MVPARPPARNGARLSPTLRCPACGARWHTAARRGRTPATDTCLRCGGQLAEESDPLAALEALLSAWERDDLDAVTGLCHPEVEIEEIAELVPGHESRFEGREGARRWMELIRELWDVEFRSEPRERRVRDDRVIEVVSDLVARSSGDRADYTAVTCSLWEFEDRLLRRVGFSVARETAPGAPRA